MAIVFLAAVAAVAHPIQALADAQTETATAEPLTCEEQMAFVAAVSACWTVSERIRAEAVSVTVRFALTRGGEIVDGEIMLQTVSTDDGVLAEEAFQSARRAVVRCAAGGYDLPPEKYEVWQTVELTFDPAQMQME